MSNWKKTSILFSLTVTLGLGIMEYSLRYFSPQTLVREYAIPDLDLGTYISPNATFLDNHSENSYLVRTNSDSFRMNENTDLSKNRKRVLVYGDSFTFGWGLEYDKTYFAALKQQVELRYPQIQLLNSSVGGYSSGHFKKLMERHIPVLKPRGIIYFFNNNDIIDNAIIDQDYQVTQFTFKTNGEVVLNDVYPFPIWKRILLNYTPYSWLNRYSHLFVATKDILKSYLKWQKPLSATKMNLWPTNITKKNTKYHQNQQRPNFTINSRTELHRDLQQPLDPSPGKKTFHPLLL